MEFRMIFGLKLGCVIRACGLLLCVGVCMAQEWEPIQTFDLPVYGIYHSPIPSGHDPVLSDEIYWNNLAKAFQQNPQKIIHGIEASKNRLDNRRKMFRDQYGRLFLWDPKYGAIPVLNEDTSGYPVRAVPVIFYDTMTGYIYDNSLGQKVQVFLPQKGILIKRVQDDHTECDPNITPMLSFNDGGESVDPCTGKAKDRVAEFGITATSGMADVLCMFCQHIKNLQCIWQFCSHPDGVYKIKVGDKQT